MARAPQLASPAAPREPRDEPEPVGLAWPPGPHSSMPQCRSCDTMAPVRRHCRDGRLEDRQATSRRLRYSFPHRWQGCFRPCWPKARARGQRGAPEANSLVQPPAACSASGCRACDTMASDGRDRHDGHLEDRRVRSGTADSLIRCSVALPCHRRSWPRLHYATFRKRFVSRDHKARLGQIVSFDGAGGRRNGTGVACSPAMASLATAGPCGCQRRDPSDASVSPPASVSPTDGPQTFGRHPRGRLQTPPRAFDPTHQGKSPPTSLEFRSRSAPPHHPTRKRRGTATDP